MCVDVDDPVEVLQSKLRTARKTYKCDECGRTIQAGERYRYEFWTYEGDTESGRTCIHCEQARRWNKAVCGGSFYYGAVLDDVVEHWTEGEVLHSLAFGRLVIGCRDRWHGGKDALLSDAVMRAAIASCGGSEVLAVPAMTEQR